MLKNKKFDIILPVGPNEIPIIVDVVQHIEKNVLNYNKIYLISCDSTLNVSTCTTIDENIFPFNKNDIRKYINGFLV